MRRPQEPSLLYPKKTKNPNPSPIGNRFGFFLFGGRGWIRTTEAEKQQIYSLSPLATREHAQILFTSVAGRLVYFIRLQAICQLLFSDFCSFDKSITKFNKFSPDFLCILAQHKQAVKFCFLAASFIRSVLPILSSRPAFPAMRSLSYIMVTLLFVMRSAPVPAGIGGTWSPHSYTRESSGGSC